MEFCRCGKLMKVTGIDYENFHVCYKCMDMYMDFDELKKHDFYIKTYTKEEFENLEIIKVIEKRKRIKESLKKRRMELC